MDISLDTPMLEAYAERMVKKINQEQGGKCSKPQMALAIEHAREAVEDVVREATDQPYWRWGETISIPEHMVAAPLFDFEEDLGAQASMLLVSPRSWRIGSDKRDDEECFPVTDSYDEIVRKIEYVLTIALFTAIFGWSHRQLA